MLVPPEIIRDSYGRFAKGSLLGKEAPQTAPAAVRPTVKDLYWAAGYLEGEGHFTKRRSEMAMAESTDEEPIIRLFELFGGTKYSKQLRPGGTAKKLTRYVWRVHGSRARGVIMTLHMLLSPRRRMAISKALE